MSIQAIALDMDGTILGPKNSIDNKLVKKLEDLKARGIRIFIATGRTLDEIKEVLPPSFPVDGLVTANGMGCYIDDKQIMLKVLDKQLVEKVVTEARKRNIYYEVHPAEGPRFALEEDKEYITSEVYKEAPETLLLNENLSRKESIEKYLHWLPKLDSDNVIKVYFFSMDVNKINDWKRTLKEIKEQTDFSIYSSSLHNAEIMVSNVSKATGIQILLDKYDISSNALLTIGDGDNDIPMFELAAHSVAMKNAEDMVKREADEVTKYSYEENGLYEYLVEKF